jgi:hypothetical protein
MLQALVVPLGASPVATSKRFPPDAGILEPLANFPVPSGINDVDGSQIVLGLKGAGTVHVRRGAGPLIGSQLASRR